MTDAKHHSLFGPALRGIFAALGSDAIQKVLGLSATLIVLSVLKPYDYGLWQLLLSVLTAFDVLLLPSVGSMLIADVSREIGEGRRNRAGAIVVRAVPLFIALGTLAALFMCLAAPFVTRASGIDLTLWIYIVSGSLIAEGVMQGYHIVFQGTLELVHAQVLKILKRFFYVLGIGVLLLGFHMGITGVAVAYTISLVVPIVVYAPFALSRFRALIRGREGGHHHFIEAVWERGRWSVLGEIVAVATASAWPWIVGYYLSVADIGYISVATMVLGQVASLAPISFILRSVLPRTMEIEGRTRAWLARSMKYAVWSQIFGGLAVVAAVYFVVPLFFPAYRAVVPLVAALIVTLPIRAVGAVASEWFFATKQQRALFLVSNMPKIPLLVLLPPLLAFFGVFGFALHLILSADILTYLRLRLIAKREGGHISLGEILVPDREDQIIFRRILDALWEMRYTRS